MARISAIRLAVHTLLVGPLAGCAIDSKADSADVSAPEELPLPASDTTPGGDHGMAQLTITWREVQPVYEAHCGACHSAGSGVPNGETNFVTDYEEAVKPSGHCLYAFGTALRRTVAHCAVEKIANGSMPPEGIPVPERDVLIMREFVLDGLLRE